MQSFREVREGKFGTRHIVEATGWERTKIQTYIRHRAADLQIFPLKRFGYWLTPEQYQRVVAGIEHLKANPPERPKRERKVDEKFCHTGYIAKKLGCSNSTVCRWLLRTTYKRESSPVWSFTRAEADTIVEEMRNRKDGRKYRRSNSNTGGGAHGG